MTRAWPAATAGIIFDLDDTLYPLDAYRVSGFRAVADYLAARMSVPSKLLFELWSGFMANVEPGHELQIACNLFGLSHTRIPELEAVVRRHQPKLLLPRDAAATLAALREDFRIGILTNGDPVIQKRKIAALGLDSLVDAIVHADADGLAGKADPAALTRMLNRLEVTAKHCVMVGDHAVDDVLPARNAGLCTIRMSGYSPARVPPGAPRADAVVERISDVPILARMFVHDAGETEAPCRVSRAASHDRSTQPFVTLAEVLCRDHLLEA